MADKLAKRLENLNESSTIRMAKLSREMAAKGHDVINLSVGEPDFDTPDHIKKAAIQAIEEGYTSYPPVPGYPDLRQAITDKFKRENNLSYDATQIIVSTGAKQSIINVFLALLDEGDEIIVPAPYWVSYPEMIKLTGATPVIVNAGVEQDFKITPAQLEAAITSKTKAFVFSSPCNPTGSIYSGEELKGLVEVFAKHPDIYIISDEIYEHINFAGEHTSIAEFPEVYARTIVINGVSKAFAMTGWRVGYMAASPEIAKACEKLQGQFTSGACSISQRATLAALTTSLAPTGEMKAAFHRRRDLALEKLKDVEGMKFNLPQGAFYLFPDISSYFGKGCDGEVIHNSEELCMYLLREAKVSLVAGSGFGADDCLRISYATSDEKLAEACDRIMAALAKLK